VARCEVCECGSCARAGALPWLDDISACNRRADRSVTRDHRRALHQLPPQQVSIRCSSPEDSCPRLLLRISHHGALFVGRPRSRGFMCPVLLGAVARSVAFQPHAWAALKSLDVDHQGLLLRICQIVPGCGWGAMCCHDNTPQQPEEQRGPTATLLTPIILYLTGLVKFAGAVGSRGSSPVLARYATPAC
jgi:hypothetical protein